MELLDYLDKLEEAGYVIEKEHPNVLDSSDYCITIKDFFDLKRIADILGEFSLIIHFSTKGDEPTLEIYDNYRE